MTEAPKPVVTAPELQPAPAPEPVEVKVGDKTLKVDKATADALTAYQAAQDAAGVATKAEIKKLADQLAKLAPVKAANSEPAPTDLDQLIFTNPKEALRLIKAEVLAEVNGELGKTSAQQAFWTEFYRQNANLQEHDWLVKAVMTREFKTLAPMDVPSAIKHLSTTVKGDILKLGGKSPSPAKNPGLEGGNELARKSSNAADVSESSPTEGGLTSVLKQRRAARAAAARGERPAA